jgi:hypothetical protein
VRDDGRVRGVEERRAADVVRMQVRVHEVGDGDVRRVSNRI